MMRLALGGIAALALAGCDTAPHDPVVQTGKQQAQDVFWTALSSHCGKAYSGQLVSDDEADAAMRGAEMVMHVRDCSDQRIAIPFHIRGPDGEWDRSRTWLVTRTDDDGVKGLRLKHDHRHEDGSSDAVTMYGGDTNDAGTARAQAFPVDDESIALFKREGLEASITNTWRMEVDSAGTADAKFAYQLTRPAPLGEEKGRKFRVEFDATKPIDPPPAPWGWEKR